MWWNSEMFIKGNPSLKAHEDKLISYETQVYSSLSSFRSERQRADRILHELYTGPQ